MHSDDDRPVIPAGMKAWGPDSPGYPNAPADWDGGSVLLRRGTVQPAEDDSWRHDHPADWGAYDAIAYTTTRFDGFARILPDAPEGGVTQEDRIAAANLLDEISVLLDHNGIGQVADLIRDGEYDEHDAVIAFHRYRQQAEARLASAPKPRAVGTSDEREVLREALERVMTAISALGERSPGTPNVYFDEHPMSDEGVRRWSELNDAGTQARAALGTAS